MTLLLVIDPAHLELTFIPMLYTFLGVKGADESLEEVVVEGCRHKVKVRA